VEKKKEIVVDFRRNDTQHPHPQTIGGTAVEQVSCTPPHIVVVFLS